MLHQVRNIVASLFRNQLPIDITTIVFPRTKNKSFKSIHFFGLGDDLDSISDLQKKFGRKPNYGRAPIRNNQLIQDGLSSIQFLFTQVKSEDELADGLAFPTLTFCQNNPFTYRKMDWLPFNVTKKDMLDLRWHLFPAKDPLQPKNKDEEKKLREMDIFLQR